MPYAPIPSGIPGEIPEINVASRKYMQYAPISDRNPYQMTLPIQLIMKSDFACSR